MYYLIRKEESNMKCNETLCPHQCDKCVPHIACAVCGEIFSELELSSENICENCLKNKIFTEDEKKILATLAD